MRHIAGAESGEALFALASNQVDTVRAADLFDREHGVAPRVQGAVWLRGGGAQPEAEREHVSTSGTSSPCQKSIT